MCRRANDRVPAIGPTVAKLKYLRRTIHRDQATGHAGGVVMSAAEPILPRSSGALDADMLRRLERLGLTGQPDQWTERYLLCEKLVDPAVAETRQEFEASSRFIRDLVA